MNTCQLMGRLTMEPEIRYTPNNIAVASFTLAVDRPRAKDREPAADFIPIIAWRERAEFISKYFHKGQRIALTGAIRTRNYEGKDGNRVYVTEVVADRVFFADSKQEHSAGEAPPPAPEPPSISDDDEYPF